MSFAGNVSGQKKTIYPIQIGGKMISDKLQKAINEQIKWELYSGYLYLAMAGYFLSENLDGFANFFFKQEIEERNHAFKFVHFLNEKGGKLELDTIEKPKNKFNSVENVFEIAYEHEQAVTQRIHSLLELAIKENDHSVASFLKWYVDEQVEEEATMDSILHKVKMIGNNPGALLMMDARLGERK